MKIQKIKKDFLVGEKLIVNGTRDNGKSFSRNLFVISVSEKNKSADEIIFLSNKKTKEKTHALTNGKMIYLVDDNKPTLAKNCTWIFSA